MDIGRINFGHPPTKEELHLPLSQEELAYFTLNRNETWPVKVADGAESASSTSQASHGQEPVGFLTPTWEERLDNIGELAHQMFHLVAAIEAQSQAMREMTESNRQLIAALIEQGQEEGEMPSTQYLNGKPLR